MISTCECDAPPDDYYVGLSFTIFTVRVEGAAFHSTVCRAGRGSCKSQPSEGPKDESEEKKSKSGD